MGLLSGGGATLFGQLFAPLYLSGTYYSTASSYDEKGTLQITSTEHSCLVQVDRCTERMVQSEGYSHSDRAIYILATSLEVQAETGADVVVNAGPYAGTRWRLASPVESDPCEAYALARASQVKVAAGG